MRQRVLANILIGLTWVLMSAGWAMAQGGNLVKAEWGVPGNRVDVTGRVRTLVHDGVLQFEVTRFALGIDPAPHQNKDLMIRVRRWDGKIEEFSYPERSLVKLELDPEGTSERHEDEQRAEDRAGDRFERREGRLQIVRAYYGAEHQFVNVTDVVRSRVDDGRIHIRVDNDSMGGDPVPGRHKFLRVLYRYNGEVNNVVVEEAAELKLP
jgi:hypothetical protein